MKVVAVTKVDLVATPQYEHLLSEGRVWVEERNEEVGGDTKWNLVAASESAAAQGEEKRNFLCCCF